MCQGSPRGTCPPSPLLATRLTSRSTTYLCSNITHLPLVCRRINSTCVVPCISSTCLLLALRRHLTNNILQGLLHSILLSVVLRFCTLDVVSSTGSLQHGGRTEHLDLWCCVEVCSCAAAASLQAKCLGSSHSITGHYCISANSVTLMC